MFFLIVNYHFHGFEREPIRATQLLSHLSLRAIFSSCLLTFPLIV